MLEDSRKIKTGLGTPVRLPSQASQANIPDALPATLIK
jgi:hypothetical protein